MNVVQRVPDLDENLTVLRADSLKTFALLVGLLGYFWLIRTVWPETGGEIPSIEALIGSGLMVLSASLSYALRERSLHIASPLFVVGALVASACCMLTFQSFDLAYLFILPVIFASVLLGQVAFLIVACMAIALTLTIGLIRIGVSIPSAALPAVIIALTALASWLSARNLHTALAWVWSGYERARHNEEVTRERAGELRRALKALDEATHRLERTNYMLALARDQAEEARRLKQQFAQTISHELRTPLNLIVGFTELMTESPEHYGGTLAPAYLRDLNIVHRNACHLQGLVNDVLDLARIEAAQMSILLEKTDPTVLVQEVVSTARSLVEARGLALHTEVEPGLPPLWLDPTRIRQVLFNLLSNAARFTDEGSITVGVRQQEDQVIFAVVDTGTGIAPGDISCIFEEFEQADGSTRRRHGGAGLGLAISKRFVELHDGRIWVESQVGRGSKFYFSLPTGQVDPAVTTSRLRGVVSRETPKGSEEPVLLAVGRSPAASALLTRYVRGCRTVAIPDLEQARHTAQQLMPQVVVIDQASVELDSGRLERLIQNWGMPRVPFIVCPLPGEELLRQRLAVDGYLIKPVTRRTLWDMLRQFGEDVDRVLVVDDDQDFVLLMGRMLEDSPVRHYHVISAYSGHEALGLMRQHRPDLVLLDLGLPDMPGFQMVKRIRSAPDWKCIPIIIVTARDELDHHEILTGPIMIAKAGGLTPGEVVRWIQSVVDTTVTPFPTPPASKEAPVL